ncbi:MAG: hypothetical protein WBK51_17680 [Polaromonas sp.]
MRPGFGVEGARLLWLIQLKKWPSDSLTHFSTPRVISPQNRTRMAQSLCGGG